jgi:G:T/U-mismatch repair DNA glycosylase
MVCFNGKGIYLTVTGKQSCSNGTQEPLQVGDVEFGCFVMPSSSARVKAYSFSQKVEILKTLAEIVNDK